MSYYFRWRYNLFPKSAALRDKLDSQLQNTLGDAQHRTAADELDETFYTTCGNDDQTVKALEDFAEKYGIEVLSC